MYMRIIFVVLVVCGIKSLYAQPLNKLIDDVTLPAPNAGALGKYGDIPVSYFTGVPNISIPIHSVSSGGIEVPITLSYHASGIRVGETASWVGMGWALQAGGMITRSVLGVPDEINGVLGYLDNGASLIDPATPNSATLTTQRQEIMNGTRDAEPDLFSFNMPGYSGKFFFDKDKNVHFIPKADIKLSYLRHNNNDRFTQFVLTAPDGKKYIFGSLSGESIVANPGIETTMIDGSSVNAPSSWYLRKIESADGLFSVSFEYVQEAYSYETLGSCRNEWGGTVGFSCSGISVGVSKLIHINRVDGRRLSKIVSKTGIINFIATTDRTDLDNHGGGLTTSKKALDKIEIHNYSTSATTCYKTIHFSYSYFSDPSGSTSEYRRLKLNSVQEKSCNGLVTKSPHSFDYAPGVVPNRLSKAIDHWGYYNGGHY